jgi:hypothetical protein
MVELDRAMIEGYHIELVQMMENAGRSLAHLARTRFLDGDPPRQTSCGAGGQRWQRGGAGLSDRYGSLPQPGEGRGEQETTHDTRGDHHRQPPARPKHRRDGGPRSLGQRYDDDIGR